MSELELGDRSFHLMREKYKEVTQECIEQELALATLKQDQAYTYQQVDQGAVEVLSGARGGLGACVAREAAMTDQCEDIQGSLEDLEIQVRTYPTYRWALAPHPTPPADLTRPRALLRSTR